MNSTEQVNILTYLFFFFFHIDVKNIKRETDIILHPLKKKKKK